MMVNIYTILTKQHLIRRSVTNMSKWKYVEYSLYDAKGDNGFYTLRKIKSYNLPINIIIGARGYGKTFAVKKYCLEKFFNNGYKTVWVRDTEDAKKVLCDNDGKKFFEDVPLMHLPDYNEGAIKRGEIYVNGTNMGSVLPASTFQRYKGNSFQECKILVYDEFIREIGRFNKNTVWETINTFSTVLRSRSDAEIYMTANALDQGDSFLEFLGLNLRGFGFYINRDKGVVLHYADTSDKFIKKTTKGIVGKLVVNTPLEKNLIESKFMNQGDLTFTKLPSKCRLVCVIQGFAQGVRLYQCGETYYVTDDINGFTYPQKRFCLSLEACDRYLPVLPQKIRKRIRENMEINNILFQNEFQRKFFINYIFHKFNLP